MKNKGVSTSTPQMPAIQNTILENFMSCPDWCSLRPGAAVPTPPIRLSRLFATHGQPVNAQGRSGDRAPELEIVCDLGDVEEHFFQIPGHGDLFDWVGELSAGNPQARGAAGIIARYQVRAVAEKLGHVQTFFDFRNHLLRRSGARLQEVVAGADARCAGKAARGIAGGCEAKFFSGISI